jgi:MHS family alpha-ketoglutarate permease-like MFS transporter
MEAENVIPVGAADVADMSKVAARVDVKHRVTSIIAGSIGNMVEWYDWYAYSAFALYFSKVFFPAGDQTAQLLKGSAVFAVGFLARPVGGWLLGAYADRKGRKSALMLSIYMMCFGSLIICLTPGYATIGIGAPILLVVARLLQGISVGAEYGTSATYLSEMATKEHRGFYSSFQYVTLILGQLLALALLILLQQFLLTPAQLDAWGWRIPFFVGACCAVSAMMLRRNMEETSSFKKSHSQEIKKNLIFALMEHPRAVFTVIGLTLGGTVAFYTYSIYMQKFLANTAGLSKSSATLISAATLFLFMLLQPIMGSLSDKVGRRPLLIGFGVLGTILTVPIMTAVSHSSNVWLTTALIMAALFIVSGYTSINAVVKAELFPVEIRALGVGLPYALTVSIFGGTAEYIALWLKQAKHEEFFYWYVSGCVLCSLLVYVFMRDTKKTSLIED